MGIQLPTSSTGSQRRDAKITTEEEVGGNTAPAHPDHLGNFDPCPEFEVDIYRNRYSDLSDMDDVELSRHYQTFGILEGRCGNRLVTRGDFVDLLPRGSSVLEIGPFCNPLLSSPNVRYFDVLDRSGLERRAQDIDYPSKNAPDIDYVSPTGDLAIIQDKFQFIVSSHCIEHQPDLINHLQQASRILRENGRYLLLIPDKRFCFDAYLAETNLAEVIEAHCEKRVVHTRRSVLEHRALITHNDSAQHWMGQHGEQFRDVAQRLSAANIEFDLSKGRYIDVHAWQFTPASMVNVIHVLSSLAYIDLEVERVYPTRRGHNEFWCILKKAN